ncbi:MAG: ADP-ribosylglycohydrolase family protein [Clostridia bacterium]|nr:ADP-ribosylglycohydrolase family protein [Clostridia bacterium]
MLGAIIGDIVGSIYEWNGRKTKDFPLFGKGCSFTDDSVMTLAIADGLMAGGSLQDYTASMRKLGRAYPGAGYGGRFCIWLRMETPESYNSFGNGSAMRVSPVAWGYDTLEEVEEAARITALPTHNHPEGVKGAQAAAAAIFMARTGKSKQEIREYIENKYGYDLHRTLDEIRPTYRFYVTCQQTVPEAIIAFLESTDFEDAIRCAISLGGDSDTLAAITGSIAEAAYGIPEDIRKTAYSFLPPELKGVCLRFDQWLAEGRAVQGE